MAVRLQDIRAVNWSPKLGAPGEIVQDAEDIAQSIRILVATPRRSVPHHPERGTDVWQHLDKPADQLEAAIFDQLMADLPAQEPRAEFLDIRTTPQGERVTIAIVWRPRVDGAGEIVTEVTL